MASLFLFGDVAVVDPAIAVSGDLVPGGAQRAADLRVEFQRPADSKGGQRQVTGSKQLQDAPHAGAGAVFIHALDAQIPFAHTRRAARQFVQIALRLRITIEDRAAPRLPRC